MVNVFRALAVSALALIARGEDVHVPSPHVPLLTTSSFDEFVAANPTTLVKFMAPWCGHCKRLAGEYEGAAEELKKLGSIPLAEIDATVSKELADKFNVQGYPTLLLFRDGKPEPYSGGRTKSTIVEWVQKMTGPAVERLSSMTEAVNVIKKAAEAAATSHVAFVAQLPSKTDEAATAYESTAHHNRMKGTFFSVVDSSVKKASVTVYRKNEEPQSTPIENKEKLQAWVDTESVPYFGPVNGDNYAHYSARSSNWVWFAGSAADYDKVGAAMRKVSRNYRTDFNFVWLDTEVLQKHAEQALGLKNFPSVAVVWEEAKYHFDDKEEVTEKAFTKFIESVKAGKVKRFLKSEPVPETNDEPVKVVVGSQFSEIVLNKDKDVFLKIYAPWCGHCKKLVPTWEKLAQVTKGSDNFVVAKFDGTQNEPDVTGFDFHGFPTLYFIKAGSKTPISYDGERTVDGLLAFAKSNAAHPINVDGAELKKDEL